MDPVISVYRQHVQRFVTTCSANKTLVEHAFLNKESSDHICETLRHKIKQTEADGEHHNALMGFQLPFESPSFCVIEIGCCSSVAAFSRYWAERNFDSYDDYVQGILSVEGKGFDIFQRMTGEPLPTPVTRETVSRFLVGHVLHTEQERILLMSALWRPATEQYGIATFASELMDKKTTSPQESIRHFVLTREEIEAKDVDPFLLGIAREIEARGGISELQGKIAFSIAGYDTDPREVWEVPEIREYFAQIDRKMPFFLYYIANEAHASLVRVFLKMFMPPSFFEQLQVSDETRDAALAFLLSRLNEVTAYCVGVSSTEGLAVDPDETAFHALRCCGKDVSRDDVKRMHA